MPGIDIYTATMLHFDGTNGSTANLIDNSSVGISWGLVGNAQLTTTTRTFGSASLSLDGTVNTYTGRGQGATSASSNFTIDFWIRANTTAVSQAVFSQTDKNGVGFGAFAGLISTAVQFNFFSGSSNTAWDITGGGAQLWGTPNISVWEHWAVTRASSIFRLYQNGTLNTTFTSTLVPFQAGDQPLLVGALGFNGPGNTEFFYNGCVDEFRFSNGIARWTGSSFALPTQPYDAWETDWNVQSLDRINSKPRIMGY